MFHAYGILVFVLTMLWSEKIVLLPRFDEDTFLHCIEKYKISKLHVVPPIMVFFAKSPKINNYDLSSIQQIVVGAAPTSEKIIDSVMKRIGVQRIFQGYGMTEGTLAFTSPKGDLQKRGSVGFLQRGIYGRVVDIASGKVLGSNQRGELQFKGNTIMKGYIGDRQATSATIDSDGWLHTGDIGYYDENGEWYIVDRIKELIKYKAFQVPPAEIEALLLTHKEIKDVGVIGIEDELCGELACAFVVKQPNSKITEKEIIKFVAGKC